MWVYLKDKFNISNEGWHELAMKCKDMPTKYKICRHLDKLNASWNLKSTPGDAEGIQISFKQSLEEQTKRLQKKKKKKTANNHSITYSIEYFLGGDWKFLACVCGLGAANQNLPVLGASAQDMKGLTSAKSGL